MTWPPPGGRRRRRGPLRDQPALGLRMLARAIDAGLPAKWVTADEAYGKDAKFRLWLQQRRIGYVLAVPRTRRSRLSTAAPAPTLWLRLHLSWRGNAAVAATASKGHVSMTGRSPRCRTPAPLNTATPVGCWSAAASPSPPNWPTTCATARTAPTTKSSSGSPGPVGPSRYTTRGAVQIAVGFHLGSSFHGVGCVVGSVQRLRVW